MCRLHMGVFVLLGIGIAPAFIGAETLVLSLCYEDGVAMVTHAKRGLLLCQHEAEHHLQVNQQRTEIPNDGRFA